MPTEHNAILHSPVHGRRRCGRGTGMNPARWRQFGTIALCCVLMLAASGCQTTVTMDPSARSQVSENRPVTEIRIRVASDAQEKFRREAKGFDADALAAVVRHALESKKLFTDAGHPDGFNAEIVVTNLRFRSAVSAAILGALAGTDEIAADVRIVPNGRDGRAFEFTLVSSHGGGGYVQSSMDARLEWMYGSFADKFLETLNQSAK